MNTTSTPTPMFEHPLHALLTDLGFADGDATFDITEQDGTTTVSLRAPTGYTLEIPLPHDPDPANQLTAIRNELNMLLMGEYDLDEAAEQVIGLHGETWLLEALETWCREMGHYPKHGFDLHEVALEIHSHRIFDSEGWIDYIPFNRRFRPGVVEGRRFPKVRVDCCDREISEVTEEALRRDMVPCPGCGAFRSYEVIERPE